MAQNTILAAGQTEALSTDVTVAAGATITVGIFASVPIPHAVALALRFDTPGRDNVARALTRKHSTFQVTGPATVRVHRPDITAQGVNVGVFTES